LKLQQTARLLAEKQQKTLEDRMRILQRRQLTASSLDGHIQLKEILEHILRQGGSARVEALQMNLLKGSLTRDFKLLVFSHK
jgi:hypothetical protein